MVAPERGSAVEALAADLAHARVRNWLRKEIWMLLVEAGLLPARMLMPAAKTKCSKDYLRLIPPQRSDT